MSSIGDRMKKYESVSSQLLITRMPVIIRIDGKSFHTYTRGCKKPFDDKLNDAMVGATIETMKNMMGCVLAYHQSDEVSFLLVDYQTLETAPWFENKVQKLSSVTASYFTMFFNNIAENKTAVFDARCFNLTKEEVPNYFVWRTKDWYRNSLQVFAQSLYSQKQLHKKKCEDLHEMIYQKGMNWNNLDLRWKNGTFIIRNNREYIKRCDILPNYESVNNLVSPLVNI